VDPNHWHGASMCATGLTGGGVWCRSDYKRVMGCNDTAAAEHTEAEQRRTHNEAEERWCVCRDHGSRLSMRQRLPRDPLDAPFFRLCEKGEIVRAVLG
jgi:hypothetical protein